MMRVREENLEVCGDSGVPGSSPETHYTVTGKQRKLSDLPQPRDSPRSTDNFHFSSMLAADSTYTGVSLAEPSIYDVTEAPPILFENDLKAVITALYVRFQKNKFHLTFDDVGSAGVTVGDLKRSFAIVFTAIKGNRPEHRNVLEYLSLVRSRHSDRPIIKTSELWNQFNYCSFKLYQTCCIGMEFKKEPLVNESSLLSSYSIRNNATLYVIDLTGQVHEHQDTFNEQGSRFAEVLVLASAPASAPVPAPTQPPILTEACTKTQSHESPEQQVLVSPPLRRHNHIRSRSSSRQRQPLTSRQKIEQIRQEYNANCVPLLNRFMETPSINTASRNKEHLILTETLFQKILALDSVDIYEEDDDDDDDDGVMSPGDTGGEEGKGTCQREGFPLLPSLRDLRRDLVKVIKDDVKRAAEYKTAPAQSADQQDQNLTEDNLT